MATSTVRNAQSEDTLTINPKESKPLSNNYILINNDNRFYTKVAEVLVSIITTTPSSSTVEGGAETVVVMKNRSEEEEEEDTICSLLYVWNKANRHPMLLLQPLSPTEVETILSKTDKKVSRKTEEEAGEEEEENQKQNENSTTTVHGRKVHHREPTEQSDNDDINPDNEIYTGNNNTNTEVSVSMIKISSVPNTTRIFPENVLYMRYDNQKEELTITNSLTYLSLILGNTSDKISQPRSYWKWRKLARRIVLDFARYLEELNEGIDNNDDNEGEDPYVRQPLTITTGKTRIPNETDLSRVATIRRFTDEYNKRQQEEEEEERKEREKEKELRRKNKEIKKTKNHSNGKGNGTSSTPKDAKGINNTNGGGRNANKSYSNNGSNNYITSSPPPSQSGSSNLSSSRSKHSSNNSPHHHNHQRKDSSYHNRITKDNSTENNNSSSSSSNNYPSSSLPSVTENNLIVYENTSTNPTTTITTMGTTYPNNSFASSVPSIIQPTSPIYYSYPSPSTPSAPTAAYVVPTYNPVDGTTTNYVYPGIPSTTNHSIHNNNLVWINSSSSLSTVPSSSNPTPAYYNMMNPYHTAINTPQHQQPLPPSFMYNPSSSSVNPSPITVITDAATGNKMVINNASSRNIGSPMYYTTSSSMVPSSMSTHVTMVNNNNDSNNNSSSGGGGIGK